MPISSGSTDRAHGKPAAKRHDRPDDFDEPERPRALQKAINGAERARKCKGENEPRAAFFERIEDDAGGDCEKAEDSQRVQVQLCGTRVREGKRRRLHSEKCSFVPFAVV